MDIAFWQLSNVKNAMMQIALNALSITEGVESAKKGTIWVQDLALNALMRIADNVLRVI